MTDTYGEPGGTRVSIVMPTRNRAGVLPRAIESVRRQTVPDFELIIVDDASTDSTPGVLRRYAATDARLRVHRLDTSVGAAAARNRGLALARGEFIAFLDDDDEWLPEKLERQLAAFRAVAPDVGVVHTSFVEADASGRERVRGTRAVPRRDARARLLAGNLLGHSSVLVRRSALDAVGGFDERLPRLQDWDLWIRLAGSVRFHRVATPLVRVHATAGNISTDDDALRRASAMLRSKFEADDTLTRRELTNLYHGLGRLLVEHGMAVEGRSLILRSLKRGWWPPQRVLVALAALLGPAFYRGVAGAFLDSVGWLSSVRARRSRPGREARTSRGRDRDRRHSRS